jgi:hypothetical protein
MHFDRVGAVFERIADALGLVGELALLADGMNPALSLSATAAPKMNPLASTAAT